MASAFTTPTLFGAEILSFEANVVTNYSYNIDAGRYASRYAQNATDLNFCNVSLHYTHSGYDDDVNVQVWLPLDTWNGKFQGTGGGGFTVGLQPWAMAGGVFEGFATASSDGGHVSDAADDWVLKSPGNLNWAHVTNFGSVSLYDFTVLGQQITADYYGIKPEYSYFTGCSTGGRQALMLAQRWPELYDGILAGAPGINYAELVSWISYPQLMMLWLGKAAQPCETAALTAATIKACDHLDGVEDGIISAPELCDFDPLSIINTTIPCKEKGEDVQLSEEAVMLADAVWTGSRSRNGTFLWHGLNKDAPLTGLANTTRDYQGAGNCSGVPFAIARDWIKYFIYRDPEFNFSSVTHEQYERIVQLSFQEFNSPLGSSDPDIRLFGQTGKVIMWHGLGDQLVPINGSRQYYEIAAAIDPNTTDYFRYFEAPGVHHCRQGPGPYPGEIFKSLQEWVEEKNPPETVHARSMPKDGVVYERDLCAYPKVQKYKGEGNVTEAESFECVPPEEHSKEDDCNQGA